MDSHLFFRFEFNQVQKQEEGRINFFGHETDRDTITDISLGEIRESVSVDDLEEIEIQDQVLSEIYYKNNLAYLNSLKNINPDWDSHNSEPPNDLAIENAQSALSILYQINIQPDKVLPTSDSGVLFRINKPTGYILIEFFANGEIALLSRSNDKRDVFEIDLENLAEIFSDTTELAG